MADEQKRLPRIRRVVTGRDSRGRSIVAMDEAAPVAFVYQRSPDFGAIECWRTGEMPVDNATAGDASTPPFGSLPPAMGSNCRIVQFPPDRTYRKQWEEDGGMHGVAEGRGDAQRTSMHRTKTLDYVIVLEGEIHAVLEEGETLLRKGDILVQRGTSHAWSNRSDRPCILAVIMLDAAPLPD